MSPTYQLHPPPHLHFGWGTRHQLPHILPHITHDYTTYAIIAGTSQHRQEIPQQLAETLPATPAFTSTGHPPEPTLHHVDTLIRQLRQHPVSLLIAIGGGSTLDIAKAAAAIAPAGGSCADYFHNRRHLTRPGIPLVALPTTAGTGTEITKNAVLTDPQTNIKQSIRHPGMVPRAAIIDPQLTCSCPPHVTAASGLDALTQAIESALSRHATHLSRPLARQAVSLIWPALPTAYTQPDHRQARTAIAEGSMLAAIAFSHSSLGAVHGLAHPIGSLLHLPHGYVCAILLPHILRLNQDTAKAELTHLAQLTNTHTPQALIQAITHLNTQLHIPPTFAQDGLHPNHHDFIINHCRSNSMRSNPRHIPDPELRQLLQTLST